VVKQVIVIRKDLKMRRGKEISQGAHASMAVINNIFIGYPFRWLFFPFNILNFIFTFIFNRAFRNWLTGSFTKICLVVNSEQELLEIYRKAKEKNIICSLIKDKGLTEFNGVPTFTSVAIGPDYSEKIDPITKNLGLY
jgi:PTH2 family peptidyl-tRNA hydrolase